MSEDLDKRHLWHIYREPADPNDKPELIEVMDAEHIISESEALVLASQYFEIPAYDLRVRRADLDTQKGN